MRDGRRLTVWRARCFSETCRSRHGVRVFHDASRADAWVLGHARNAGWGGHVVAVWCSIAGQVTWRPHMIRFADAVQPVGGWLGWGWACLTCHLDGDGHPVWREGHMSRRAVLTEWQGHECNRRVDV